MISTSGDRSARTWAQAQDRRWRDVRHRLVQLFWRGPALTNIADLSFQWCDGACLLAAESLRAWLTEPWEARMGGSPQVASRPRVRLMALAGAGRLLDHVVVQMTVVGASAVSANSSRTRVAPPPASHEAPNVLRRPLSQTTSGSSSGGVREPPLLAGARPPLRSDGDEVRWRTQLGGWPPSVVLDADWICTSETLIRRWRRREGLVAPRLLPFVATDAHAIWAPEPDRVHRLTALLRQAIDARLVWRRLGRWEAVESNVQEPEAMRPPIGC